MVRLNILHLSALAFLLLLFNSNLSNAQDEPDPVKEGHKITIMTYNLKFASPTFEPSWEVRREMQVNLIRTKLTF